MLPLRLHEIWAIRTRLQIEEQIRDLALFNLAVDSKLRASDLVRLRVSDVATGGHVCSPATILQKKTGRPFQFEITPRTREAVECWISRAQLTTKAYLFPSRFHGPLHLSTRQYDRWSNPGFPTLAWTHHSMAPIRCGAQKRP